MPRNADGDWLETEVSYDFREVSSVDELHSLYDRDGFLAFDVPTSDAMLREIARGFGAVLHCNAVSPAIEMWYFTSDQANEAWHFGLGSGWRIIVVPLDQFETPEFAIENRKKIDFVMLRHEWVDPFIQFAIEDGRYTG